MPRLAVLSALAACLFFTACGGGDESSSPEPDQETAGPGTDDAGAIPGDADPEDVRVIDEWAKALAEGDVDAAATYFRIPSVAENGGVLLQIESVGEARLFNESLPCGAEVIHADSQGEFTTATFQLKERPGPGVCGPGKDSEAKTAFVIEDGKIVEWRRVGVVPQAAPGRAT